MLTSVLGFYIETKAFIKGRERKQGGSSQTQIKKTSGGQRTEILCFDPTAKLFYLQNLFTNEIKSLKTPPKDIKIRVESQLDALNEILFGKEEDKVALFSKEALKVRTKKIRKHFLQRDVCKYPSMINSHSYEVGLISVEMQVFLNEYSETFGDKVITLTAFLNAG